MTGKKSEGKLRILKPKCRILRNFMEFLRLYKYNKINEATQNQNKSNMFTYKGNLFQLLTIPTEKQTL